MRKNMIAGNWKMNMTLSTSLDLVSAIKDLTSEESRKSVDVVICPPSLFFFDVARGFEGYGMKFGVQNLFHKESGAYTGEISAPMIEDYASYVIVGHSERRKFFCETDSDVRSKVERALIHGLIPIVCVGESEEVRAEGNERQFVLSQVRTVFKNLEMQDTHDVVIAYEPLWAIGSGSPATPEMADEMLGFIRDEIGSLFGHERAERTQILYGGSTKPSNIASFLYKSNIDGALVGGASLDASLFAEMIQIASV